MRAKALFASLVMGLVAVVGVHPGAQTPEQSTESTPQRRLELKFDGNGYVSLIAQNVSVAEVFAEWARVGKTRVQNADRLPRNPISVQFDKIEEQELVDALVRQSKAQGAGWIVAARQTDAPAAPSRLEVIAISPQSSPSTTFIATQPSSQPLYPQGTIDDNEMPPVTPPFGVGPGQPQPQSSQPVTRPPTNTGPGVPLVPVGPPTTPLPGSTNPPPPNPTGRGRGGF
jgi:hypothetical protein